jgi:hypothetical protein
MSSCNAKNSRWVKTRLTADQWAALAVRADHAGKTVSAYLRELIIRERGEFDLREALHGIEARLAPKGVAGAVDLEPLIMEAVLLGREQLARRDPQALAHVRAQMQVRYPGKGPSL